MKHLHLVFFLWGRNFKNYIDLEKVDKLDLKQELKLIALEIDNLNMEKKEIYKYIGKRIYRFVRNYGFRRPRHSKSYISNTKMLKALNF